MIVVMHAILKLLLDLPAQKYVHIRMVIGGIFPCVCMTAMITICVNLVLHSFSCLHVLQCIKH